MYCNIYLNQCYFCLSAFQVRRDQVEFVDESETKERVITLIFHLRVEKGNFQHVEYEYCYLSIKTCLISICLTQSNRNSILKLSPCNCPLFHKEARRIILFSLIIEDLLLCFYLFILVLKTKLEKIIWPHTPYCIRIVLSTPVKKVQILHSPKSIGCIWCFICHTRKNSELNRMHHLDTRTLLRI